MAYKCILTQTENSIGTLILNRPEKLNAVIGGMREEIVSALEAFSNDSEIRTVIITGAGRGFCAGGDVMYLKELLETKNLEGLKSLLLFGSSVVQTIRQMPKPVIAAVNGPAAGAGLNLAIACDIRLASENASFGASFSKIGLHPDWGGSWFLPRLIGPARACELVFSGEMISAAEAQRIGLTNQVYSQGRFESEVRRFAEMMCARPPLALKLAKALLWKAEQQSLQETLEMEMKHQVACFESKDAWEGIHAFLEKRPPDFTGS